MEEFVKYFDSTYVTGLPRRGRRNATPPRYPIHILNQYHPTVKGQVRTNNVSEGWHNRFHLLMGKNHQDLYNFIKPVQKEQGDTEIAIVKLSLERKIKAAPKKKWQEMETKLHRIVLNYDSYNSIEYLQCIDTQLYLNKYAEKIFFGGFSRGSVRGGGR